MPPTGNFEDERELGRRFDGAMMEIYERAGAEVGYWATRYLQMLRRRGGLETARYLLKQRATSDGYAHLRDAGRLDLTVESYCLRPEFQALFTAAELNMARERLAYFGELVESTVQAAVGGEPALVAILEEASRASPEERMGYRDRVTAYGARAIPVIEWMTSEGLHPAFALSAIEAIGRTGDAGAAIQALTRLRVRHHDWASVIDAAIARLKVARAIGALGKA